MICASTYANNAVTHSCRYEADHAGGHRCRYCSKTWPNDSTLNSIELPTRSHIISVLTERCPGWGDSSKSRAADALIWAGLAQEDPEPKVDEAEVKTLAKLISLASVKAPEALARCLLASKKVKLADD